MVELVGIEPTGKTYRPNGQPHFLDSVPKVRCWVRVDAFQDYIRFLLFEAVRNGRWANGTC
jgi:hypothetical protein